MEYGHYQAIYTFGIISFVYYFYVLVVCRAMVVPGRHSPPAKISITVESGVFI